MLIRNEIFIEVKIAPRKHNLIKAKLPKDVIKILSCVAPFIFST